MVPNPLARLTSTLTRRKSPNSGTANILVTEEDATHFSFAHPKTLPFFSNPVITVYQALNSNPNVQIRGNDPLKVPSQVVEVRREDSSSRSSQEAAKSKDDPNDPVLRNARESSTIQLFFDLFFVANLTTFTSAHEINNGETLKSYIGFFGMLWFTWFQVALYDVRFSNDSIFERVCKAIQFGIMTGFAVVGPGYKTGWEKGSADAEQALSTFQTFSIILMVSRLQLAVQYGVALFWLRQYKKAWLPMGVHIAVLVIAACVYLGLYFSFSIVSGDNSIIAWYVIIAVEAITILLVSGRVRFLSFRRTAIVERLGLLTLIILGEGVIGMTGAIRKVGSDHIFTPDVIGMVICAVSIIYFIWMLYFDQTETERVGTIRQQLWALIHFPFHICVILVAEGINQLSVFRKILDILVPFQTDLTTIFLPLLNATGALSDITSEMREAMLEKLNETLLTDIYEKFEESEWMYPDISREASVILDVEASYNDTSEAVDNILAAGLNWVFSNYDLKPPETGHSASEDESSQADYSSAVLGIFDLVYVYFYLASGLGLILLSILLFLGKRHKVRADYFVIILRVLVGAALCTLIVFDLSGNDSVAANGASYIFGPWMIPTVTLSYGLVVLLDNVIISWARRILQRKLKWEAKDEETVMS